MLIEALKNCATSSHSLKSGDVVNMRKEDADKLIAKKYAKQVAKEEPKKTKAKKAK